MIIEIPDKNIELEFPDDMSHDEISSIIQRDIYGESEQPKFSVGRLGYQVYSNIAQGISDIISAQQYGERGRDIEQSEKMISQGLPSEVLGSEQQFIGEELARAAIAKGAPSDRTVPIAKYLTQDEIDQIRLSARKQKSAGFVESAGRLKESLPKPLEGAPGGIGGIVEQAAGGMARFAPSMAATAISGPAGFATTFTQIYGAEREKYDKQGVDDERAETAALMSALGQAPVEFLGNIVQIGALGEIAKSIKRPGMKRLATFAGAIIKSSISEGTEEYIQKYPELIADIYASNPDTDATKLAEKTLRTITSLKFQKQAGVEAGIGAVGGAMLAGGGGIISEGVGLTQKKEDGNLNDEQINQIVLAANEDLKNGVITPDELQSTIQKYRDVIDINQADIDTIISRISAPEEQVDVAAQKQVTNATFEFPRQTEQEQADIEREIMRQRSQGPDVLQALRERNQREIQQTKSDKEAALSEFRENLKRRISGEIPGAEVDIVRQESELSRLKSKFEDEKNAREIREDEGQVQEGGIERQGGKTEGRENLQQPEKERAETSYKEKPLEYESKKPEISKGEAVKGEMVQEVPSAEIQKVTERQLKIPESKRSDIVPEFQSGKEASEFGESATKEQVAEMERLRDIASQKSRDAMASKDYDIASIEAERSSRLREALESSRGEYPTQKDRRTPEQMLSEPRTKKTPKERVKERIDRQVRLRNDEAALQLETEERELAKQSKKERVKKAVIDNVKTGGIDGAVRFTTPEEMYDIVDSGRIRPSDEYGATFASRVMGQEDTVFPAYGKESKSPVAVIFPKDSIVESGTSKDVTIKQDVNPGDLRFIVSGSDRILTFDEISAARGRQKSTTKEIETREYTNKKPFKDSVVKNIVYHGGEKTLNEFKSSPVRGESIGIAFFTNKESIADAYAKTGVPPTYSDKAEKLNRIGGITKAYINIKNPVPYEPKEYFSSNMEDAIEFIKDDISENNYLTLESLSNEGNEKEFWEFISNIEYRNVGVSAATESLSNEPFLQYIASISEASKYFRDNLFKKYDGFIFNDSESGGITYTVFSKDQIKIIPKLKEHRKNIIDKSSGKKERRKVVYGPGGAVGFEGKLEEGKKERRIGPQEIRSTEKAESVSGRTKEVDDAIKRVKNSIKSERGSWSFEQSEHPITKDLITIGRHIYSTGATKFKDFSNRLRSTIGESFERIKNDIRNLYDNVKRTISNERGEVVIREEKFSEKPIDPKAEKIIKKLRGLYTKTGKISPAKTKKAIEKYESLTNDLREARDDIYKKQKALEKHIKSNIPKSEQYRLLSQIKKMASVAKKETREKRYNEAIEAINAVHEKSEKTKLIEKIKAELKKKRPKKTQRGIISNLRMDVKANKLISMARKYIEINRDDGIYEISEMMNKFDMENREPTPSELEKISMIQSFSGINNKTIDELKSSLETIKDIIKTGRASWMNDESARKERMNKLRDTAYEEFTGGKGLKTTEEIDREKSRKTWLSNAREALRSFDDLHQNFEFLLDKLSRFHKKTETLGGETTEYFTDLVHAATHTESSGVSKQINIVNNKLVEIFGSKNLAKTLNKNTKIKEKTGVYRYKDGSKIEKPLSQNMAYKLWQLFQQPSLIDELEKHGYTKDTLKQLEKFIDPKVLRWAEWQINEFYPQYRDGINDVYKKLFYVDMGEIEGYSPVARIYANQKQDEVLLGEGGHYSSVIAGSVKSRVKTSRDFNILDGDSILMKHISEMEHFKAWGIPMRELRSVLNSEKIQEAIVQYHGRTANNVIKQFMDHFASGGIDRVNTLGTLDKLRSNFTKSAIGANPVVFLKQLASIPAYSMDIPASSFNAGVASFFKNPIKAYKTLMKSEMMKSRYGVGFERDIKLALQRSTAKRLAGKKSITDALMITTKLGDKAAIVVGGWASYRYNYKQAKKRGLSDSKAHNFAIREFEKSTERSQQAGNVKDLAHIQRLGSLGKLFTMFMTSPSSYYRSLSAGVRNFKAGRGSKYSNVKRIVVAHFVLPMLFQFIASGFKWEKEKQLRAAVVGPLNGLFIAREAIEGFMTALLEGQAYWSLGVTPPLSTLQSVSRSGKKINRAFLDGIDEDQFWSIMSDLVEIAGTLKGVPVKTLKRTATGIGEVYRGETDKPVRRIIGFKDKEE